MKTIRRLILAILAFAFALTASPAHAAPGDPDALNPNVVGEYVLATAVQPDGKIIIAGFFFSVLGQPRNNIARLNADGTLDAGFNPNANNLVHSMALQADGSILLGGQFTSVGGIGRNRIARVDAAGAVDAGFNPNANNIVNCVAVEADGRILLGGSFTTVGGTVRNRVARVDATGTLDASFNPNADIVVRSVAPQADGRILLGGQFTSVGGIPRYFIARVDAAGAVDAGFNPNANNIVYSVAVQADGRILLAGAFTAVGGLFGSGGTARNGIARVDAAGVLDAGFNPNVNSAVYSVGVQADGRILIGGHFTSVGGTARSRIARVDAAGALDAGFNPNANDAVYSLGVQADGRILLGGFFRTVGGTVRNQFARLLNDPATRTLSAPDATQVTWTRSGSSPEVSLVTFEKSTDSGATWTPLGTGTRIGTTANWQLTGLSLPSSGQLRARGRTNGGQFNGSSGLIEQVVGFAVTYTPLQQWKLTHLSDASAPDLGDPDGDGVVTLAEYGINTLPQTANAAPHPASRFTYAEGERLRLFLQRDPTHNDVTVIAESADSLAGPWSPLATSTLGAPFTGPGYVSGDDATPGVKTVEIRDTVNITDAAARFMRVRVVRP